MHLSALMIITGSLALVQSESVPKWSLHEIKLNASGTYENPYTDVSVISVFRGPDDIQKTINGFCNGDGEFIIRFTPTMEGKWTYTTSSSDTGMDGKTGAINCIAPLERSHGFLRRDEDYPYHFIFDDGTRYFMFGNTYYGLMNREMDEWKETIDGTLGKGMNKIRFRIMPGQDTGDSLDLEHWEKLDEIVGYMYLKGMIADFIIFGFGEQSGTQEQHERYLKYVIVRYAAYPNVIWDLVNEWNYRPMPQSFWNDMGRIVRSEDPWISEGRFLRPLSIHQQTRINFQFFYQDWPVHAIIQYGVRNKDRDVEDEWKNMGKTKYRNGDEWGNAGILFNMGHNMPVVNDEYGYIGEPEDRSAPGSPTLTRKKHRQIIWGIYTAGGYACAGDKYEYPDVGRPYKTGYWQDPEEYGDIKHLIDFFTKNRIEYWRMSSKNSLVTSGERVYVLAETGRQYVIYAAIGGNFSVDLASGTYMTKRFNPRTGEYVELKEVIGGSSVSFEMPDEDDWLIYLTFR